MSETRVFQTETRPRREASTSRETENKTRNINKLNNTMSETRLFLSLLLSLSFSLYLSLFISISFSLSLTFYLSLSFSLSLFPITSCSIKMKKTFELYIFKSRFTSRENLLLLASHEKLHFSQETRTRRDLAHG